MTSLKTLLCDIVSGGVMVKATRRFAVKAAVCIGDGPKAFRGPWAGPLGAEMQGQGTEGSVAPSWVYPVYLKKVAQ